MTAEMLCDCTHRKWGHAGGTYACWDCGCKRYTPDIQKAARDHADGAPEALDPTAALLTLLAAIRDGRVTEDPAGMTTYLDVPGSNPVPVGDEVWAMNRAGWCWLPADELAWRLTDRGRETLHRGAA